VDEDVRVLEKKEKKEKKENGEWDARRQKLNF
jgi:hypothetical protein